VRKFFLFLIALASIAFGACSPASAQTPTVVGQNNNNGTTNVINSGSGTALAAVPVGATVILYINDEEASIVGVTVTDSKSNTYTKIASFAPVAGVFNGIAFSSKLTTALTTSDSITYHLNASAQSFVYALYQTGLSALDTNYTNTTAVLSGSPYTITGATTAAVANEFNFCFLIGNNGTTTLATGWTTSPVANLDPASMAAYLVNTGTSPETCSAATTSADWAMMIFAFEPSTTTVIPGPALQIGPIFGVH